MNTKLTLALDSGIINTAKNYAATHSTSLSQLVEKYFLMLTNHQQATSITALPPITNSLAGILKVKSSIDHKQLVQDALVKKYL